MDWNRGIEKVIKKGIVGTISGGLIALVIGVLSIFRKRKKG
jgi:hypothetical protein